MLSYLSSKNIDLFPTADGSLCWFSGLVMPQDSSLEENKKVCAKLQNRGIEARPFWKPIHLQKPYSDCPKSSLHLTDSLWQRILTLPCSTGITDGELKTVARAISDVFDISD